VYLGQEDNRPTILVSEKEYRTTRNAIKVLADVPGLYQRGEMLCQIVRNKGPKETWITRPIAARPDPFPAPLLQEALTRSANFITITDKGVKPVHPPGWCVQQIMARKYWPDVRKLLGVINSPTLREDGTVLCEPGYDAATGLRLEWKDKLPIPDRPTRRDALKARDRLLEVVCDFPFKKPEHKAAWIAAVLTLCCRYAFRGPAPLFLADANVPGAGKGLLLDCVSIIATDGPFSVASYTNDETELAKHITAIAMNGDTAVQFDNVTDRFGNGTLNRALTATHWQGRVLGYSRTYSGPLLTIWFATANNATIDRDTTRRICHIALESELAHPEERVDFKHPELRPWVSKHRIELLASALTILSAYCLNGRKDMKLKAWGSYEGWSALVRNAVVWADMADPGEARQHIINEDTSLTAMLVNLRKLIMEAERTRKAGITASKIIKAAQYNVPPHRKELRLALEDLLPRLDAQSLGYLLRTYNRRNIGGLFIDRVTSGTKTHRWRVRPAGELGNGRDGRDGSDG
jgi:hypothetical protein